VENKPSALTRREFTRVCSLAGAGLVAGALARPIAAGCAGAGPVLNRGALRAHLLRALEARLGPILATARPDGRIGSDPWIVRDQDAVLTLALLFKLPDSPHRGDRRLLGVAAAGGRCLRSHQDAIGMFELNKKDGSRWGKGYIAWTYLRWMLAYRLLKADLSDADRAAWAEGLKVGYAGISATELSSLSNIYPGPLPDEPPLRPGEVRPWIHNIPCHCAAGLFVAAREFGVPAWEQQARGFMGRVVGAQSPFGWWTEHVGPAVLYNRVYVEGLAIYRAHSGDDSVLPAIERANRFHLNYLYPDGSMIETVDERNPYEPLKVVRAADGSLSYRPGHVVIHTGLFFSDEGRAVLARQFAILAGRDPAEIDSAEYMLLFMPPEGAPLGFGSAPARRFRMGKRALVAREDPWTVSLSAFCAPRTRNRWIQDRQNLISVHHRAVGLILGGGNTKLQPLWSTLTVGDTSLVSPRGATRSSNLAPDVPLAYTPDQCEVLEPGGNRWALRVREGGALAEFRLEALSETTLRLGITLVSGDPSGRPAAAHLTFIPHQGCPVRFPDGTHAPIEGPAWEKTDVAGIAHHLWRLAMPVSAVVRAPVLPHNPYTDDGHAAPAEGRLVVTVPLPQAGQTVALTLRVDGA
jgi:hypothetical protein